MILDWFDAREAVAFGKEISLDIKRLFPVSISEKSPAVSAKKDRKSQKKLDGLALRTRAFALEHSLNIYKKARLLNTIKWELREQGQDESLIDELVRLLAPLLNAPKA